MSWSAPNIIEGKRQTEVRRTDLLSRAGAHFMSLAHHSIQPLLGLLIAGKPLLFGAKCRRVIVATTVYNSSRMFDVQHLVKDYVFHEPFGNVARIKRLADCDRVVGRIVMTENAARPTL